MTYENGTKIVVTKILKKDYLWFDDYFEVLSKKVNGKEGVIIKHSPEDVQHSEREAYRARIKTDDGFEDIEIELDEFIAYEQ